MIGNCGALDKRHAQACPVFLRYILKPGAAGGMIGGPGRSGRGSMLGAGTWPLTGWMTIGGMAGGADGGFF